ncbi:MAG TPA: TlpA disulfide reductase family protein [Polyangia bacterium]|nr:TlpA disulfide reductase family protein [Polyangia bacterium]
MKAAVAGTSTAGGSRLRRLWPAALTALAIAFVAARFLGAVHDSLARTRGGACTALAPDPLPGFLQTGPTPDFQLPDAKGGSVSLSAQRGHPVLLNFWATWCPPCVDEVPSLEDLARKLDGTDLRLLAVSVDDDWGAIRRFFPKGSAIGVLLDTSHDIPKKFGTEKFPESFLIDAAGRVRYYFINKRDWSRPEAVACLESLR